MNTFIYKFQSMGGTLLVVAMAIGCASGPPQKLKDQLVSTDASIAQADQSGANQGGLSDLQKAKDKRAGAQAAISDHKYDAAMALAQQAQVDAQYASRKSQAIQAQRSAVEVERGTDKLRDEAERNSSPQ